MEEEEEEEEEEEYRGIQRNTEEYKGSTNNNSPTGPNGAVRVAIVLL